MNNVLVPKVNVTIVTNRSQLAKSVKTLSSNDVKQGKPFLYCGDDDDDEAIMEEQMRRTLIEYTVSQCDDETEA
eukprot:9629431-Ditylum_brightwellii.AAC.1